MEEEGGTQSRNLGSCVLARALAGFCTSSKTPETEGSADVTAARKIRRRIPGLSEARDAPGNPDVSLAAAAVEEGVRDAVVKLGAHARGLKDDLQLGGDCRETAKQTTSRSALWRSAPSPPPLHDRAWSRHWSRISPRVVPYRHTEAALEWVSWEAGVAVSHATSPRARKASK